MSFETYTREQGDEDEVLFIQPRCYCKDFSNSNCKVPTFCNGPPKDNFAFCEPCSCFCVYDVKIYQQCRCHRKKSTVSKEFCQTGSHRPSVNLSDGGMLKSLCFPCLTKKCKVYRFKGSSIIGSPSSPTMTYEADSLPPSPISPEFAPGMSPIWPLRTTSKTNLPMSSPAESSRSPRPSSIAEMLEPIFEHGPKPPLSPPLSPPPLASAGSEIIQDTLEHRKSTSSSAKARQESKLKRASRRLRADCPLQIANRVTNLSRSLSRSSSRRSSIKRGHRATKSDASHQHRTVPGDPTKVIVPILPSNPMLISKPTKPTHQRNESAPVASTQTPVEEKKTRRRPWSTISSITHMEKKAMISPPVSFKGSTLLHGFDDPDNSSERPLSIQESPILAKPKISQDLQSRISSSSSSSSSSTSSTSPSNAGSDSDSDDLVVPTLRYSPGTSPTFLQQTGLLLAFPSPPSSRPGTPAPRSPNLSMTFSRPSTPGIRVDTSSTPAPLRSRKLPGQGRSLSPVAESPDVVVEEGEASSGAERRAGSERADTQTRRSGNVWSIVEYSSPTRDNRESVQDGADDETFLTAHEENDGEDMPIEEDKKVEQTEQDISTTDTDEDLGAQGLEENQEDVSSAAVSRSSTPTPTPTPIKAQI